MVHSSAPLLGPEEESVVEMISRCLSRRGRRGSVESCGDTDHNQTFVNSFAASPDEERLLQQDVTLRIERCLTEAKASTLHCQVLLLPQRMTTRVGQDVVSCSTDEPCGLRGAAIKVYVEAKDGLKSVGSISPDPSVTPTFELSVIFKADKDDGWPPLKRIFDTNKVLKLKAEYRLVKRKLYSSASPVIHDFN